LTVLEAFADGLTAAFLARFVIIFISKESASSRSRLPVSIVLRTNDMPQLDQSPIRSYDAGKGC
jgi:hypothetical protein